MSLSARNIAVDFGGGGGRGGFQQDTQIYKEIEWSKSAMRDNGQAHF